MRGLTKLLSLVFAVLVTAIPLTLFAQPWAITVLKVGDGNCNGQPDSGEPLLPGWIFYLDLNGNGIQDPDEPSGGTDQYGTVTFLVEKPGTYIVAEVPKPGWIQTAPGPPGTMSVTVPPSQEVVFLNVQAGSVGGKKWEDLDGDGAQDNNEPGLAGWTVHLEGHDCLGNTVHMTAQTDQSGSYLFQDVPPGTYEVWEEIPSGWTQSAPGGNGRYQITVASGQAVEGIDFGNYRPGSLRGRKWRDDDGDGIWDPGEPALSGWTIRLAGQTGGGQNVNLSAQTGTDGSFSFSGIAPGNYSLTEDLQSGWTQTHPPAGSYAIALTSGANLDGLDFGNAPPPSGPGSILGQKFLDADGGGDRDPDEPGIDGFIIELYDSQGNLVARTRTASSDVNGDSTIDPVDEQGLFGFYELAPGSYLVKEVVPPGWTQTYPAPPGTYSIQLNPGQVVDNVLFGNMSDSLDFGDLPEPALPPGTPCRGPLGQCYPTMLPAGPFHAIVGPWLGVIPPDREGNGQPDGIAAKDDTTDADDEDGVKFMSFEPGGQGEVEITVNGKPGDFPAFVNAWVDFDGDGVLANRERIIAGLAWAAPGTKRVRFAVPPNAPRGGYSRFRVSTIRDLPPVGGAVDGEVEDYFGLGLDLGDAPDQSVPPSPIYPTGYPTRVTDNGARHAVIGNVRIGPALPDADHDGQPSRYANGDDVFDRDDEDGIAFWANGSGFVLLQSEPDPDKPSQLLRIWGMVRGTTVFVQPLASVSGYLNAWIDWNRDGDWEDLGEHVIVDKPVQSGPDYTKVYLTVPADAHLGYTYARFRFCTYSGLSYDGIAENGEVEDYVVGVLPPLDLGDAPDPYPTRFAEWGARHMIGGPVLGRAVDPDLDGAPDSSAAGDDSLDANDDEDGIWFLTPVRAGSKASIQVTWNVPTGTGYLSAWIDFNRNGDWWDPGEQVFADLPFTGSGVDTLWFDVPDTASPGISYARFRFSDMQWMEPDDTLDWVFSFGEVEDYRLVIEPATGVRSVSEERWPREFALFQNYPNPFNASTTIAFDLPSRSYVTLEIYDTMGRRVKTLLRGTLQAGHHQVRWDGTDEAGTAVQSGLYVCRLRAAGVEEVRKIILLR